MSSASEQSSPAPPIQVSGLTMAQGQRVLMRQLDFTVPRGRVFAIMGGSGSGKSTLMRHLVGLLPPAEGQVRIDGEDIWQVPATRRQAISRRLGVMFQHGALWTSMTLAENVALPIETWTSLEPDAVRELVSLKLQLVGLAGFEDHYPAEISGGMRKRAGIARALALDPDVLLLDEPSAGLDPVTAKRLDDLILELRAALGTTIVVVTHELDSIFAIADDGIFLDAATYGIAARGAPDDMLAAGGNARVVAFLTRAGSAHGRSIAGQRGAEA